MMFKARRVNLIKIKLQESVKIYWMYVKKRLKRDENRDMDRDERRAAKESKGNTFILLLGPPYTSVV